MTKATALGQMANAPLALVLAQVRFSAYLTIANAIPAIQDALRRDYPVFRKGLIQTIEFGSGAPNVNNIERFDFADADNRQGFIVTPDSLVYVTTRYKTFEDFESKHRNVLDSFEKIVPDVFVERLGLRYIDVIVPRENEEPSDYVIDGLKGCAISRQETLKFSSQYIANWVLKGGAMKFRFISGVREPFMPADMREIALAPAEIINRAASAKKDDKVSIGVLDFDRMMEHKGLMRATEVSKLFSTMHEDASVAFKQSISKLAERVWNPKP